MHYYLAREATVSSVIFRIVAGLLVGALALMAGSLYLSSLYLEKEQDLAAAGDLEDAAEKARVAGRFDPFGPDPLEVESFVLQQQGRNEAAADALRGAVARDPHNYYPYLMLGNLQFFGLEDFEAAAESYRDVLRLNPKATVASSSLAQALARAGDLEGAKREYEKLEEARKITAQGLYDLGRIYVRTGEPEKGVKAINVAQRKTEASLEGLDGTAKSQVEDSLDTMQLSIVEARTVQKKYDKARRVAANSDAEQAPGILEILKTNPRYYRESVKDSELY